MPRGVPVATVAINNATNAGLLAVRMLGVADTALQARYSLFQCIISHLKTPIIVVANWAGWVRVINGVVLWCRSY